MKPAVNPRMPARTAMNSPEKPVPVIHGSVNTDGAFFFWGEGLQIPAPKKRGRKPVQKKPSPHPYALPHAALESILRQFLPCREPVAGASACLMLPTGNDGPQPSPELSREWDRTTSQKSALAPWTVPVLIFPVGSVLPLLLSVCKETKEVRFGRSVAAWSVAALFACELVTGGSFVPGFRPIKKGIVQAAWRPFLKDEDKKRLAGLAAAMPPVIRAHIEPGTPDDSPLRLAGLFIDAAVPALIGLATSRFSPAAPARHQEPARSAEEIFYRDLLYGEKNNLREDLPVVRGLTTWLLGPAPARDSEHYTTCFTVQEPASDKSAWTVNFFLQSKDDPTLLVPAGEVWNGRSRSLARLTGGKPGHPEERMLYDLGAAAKIYPPLRDVLQSARPNGITVPPDNLFRFLSETAPLLMEQGCTVLLPSWWKQGRQHPSIRIKLKDGLQKKGSGPGPFSLGTILSFDWKIAIGEEELSREEFERLAERKVPLMKVRGRWVIFDPDEVRRVITAFTKEYPDGEIPLSDALALSLGDTGSEGLPVSGIASEGQLEELLNRLVSVKGPKAVPLPKTFTGTLRPYQEQGVAWLSMLTESGMGACLADDMGLGKTVQVIAHLTRQAKAGHGKKKMLLVCPMSIIGNWTRELMRFAPSLIVYVHHGSNRCSGDRFNRAFNDCDLAITSYQTVQRDEGMLVSAPWDGVILDEAQNIKNHTTKQSRAVRKLPAKSRIVLTGTPVENRLSELWSIMEFLNPGYLGTATSFQKKFSIPIERYHDTGRAQTLKQLVRPFLLRREKTDRTIISDLPEKIISKEFCPLTKEQVSLYEAAVTEMLNRLDSLEGMKRKSAVLVTLMRLKQICDHPALFLNDKSDLALRSGKLDRLTEVLAEVLSNGERALIFTQYATFGEMLKPWLERTFSIEVLFLHGGTKREDRDGMVERFSLKKGPKIFILSLKAGGTGLNLTAANHVFHIDRWWNPAVEDQATDRAFRIGQSKNVVVHLMISAGTLEEKIDAVLEDKRALAGSVIGTGEDWITNLPTKELRDLLALRKKTLEVG
ncbi:MAG: DEAD/DEAH box helicase [Methanoregula sp.]|nr:DEAD/DEAH box helicase [Methanoregula sp.]